MTSNNEMLYALEQINLQHSCVNAALLHTDITEGGCLACEPSLRQSGRW